MLGPFFSCLFRLGKGAAHLSFFFIFLFRLGQGADSCRVRMFEPYMGRCFSVSPNGYEKKEPLEHPPSRAQTHVGFKGLNPTWVSVFAFCFLFSFFNPCLSFAYKGSYPMCNRHVSYPCLRHVPAPAPRAFSLQFLLQSHIM